MPPAEVEALWDRILAAFRHDRPGFFQETLGGKQVAFNWTFGVVLSVENALTKRNPSRKKVLVKLLETAEQYWNSAAPVPGYDSSPGPNFPTDRYYDDNAWMCLGLLESYDLTRDPRWLKRAQETLTYVLSGEQNGGILWREKEKTTRNTCANAPAIASCVEIYRRTKEKTLLEKAKQLYGWTQTALQDPVDHLYWDHLRADGTIEKTKWSYNSALMLRSAKLLHQVTKDRRYQRDAQTLEAACRQKWWQPDGTLDDELPFAHLLYENLGLTKKEKQRAHLSLLKGQGEEGFFGLRWGEKPKTKPKLIWQASALRVLADQP